MTNDNDLFEDVFYNNSSRKNETQIDDDSLNPKEENKYKTINENNSNNNVNTIDDNLASDLSETNCLALTVKKDYNLTIFKNVITATKRMSFKVICSTVFLNFLRFMF